MGLTFLVCNDEDKLDEFLIKLVRKGWLIEFKEEGSYKFHQILRDYILERYKPKFEEIEVVIDYFINFIGDTADSQQAINQKKNIIYFEASSMVLQKINSNNNKISIFFNRIALLYKYISQDKKAEEFYLKAIKLMESYIENGNEPYLASIYNNLAKFYQPLGEKYYEKAEKYYFKSLKLYQDFFKNEEELPFANTYNNLANLYCLMGKLDKSEQLYLKALKIKKEFR